MSWKWEPEYNCITRLNDGGCRVTVVDKIYANTDREWNEYGRLIALAPRMADFVNMVAAYSTVETDPAILDEAQKILRILRVKKMNIQIQIRKDCELCNGLGVFSKTHDYSVDSTGERMSSAPTCEIDCPRCTGTGMETEWIWVDKFIELMGESTKYVPKN